MATFTYNEGKKNCSTIYRVTNSGTTYSANLAGTNFEVLPTTSVVGDYVIFLYSEADYYTGCENSDLYLYLTQGQVGGTLVWEYMDKDNTWQPLISLTDYSEGLTITGSPVRVRFPRQPCARYVLIQGSYRYQPIRVRLTEGTITTPAIHSSTKPQFGNGRIYTYNAPSTAPATLQDVYDWVQVNCPEVDMTILGSNSTNVYGSYKYKKAYYLRNASLMAYNPSAVDCYIKTLGECFMNGNGSIWYTSFVGNYWIDGETNATETTGYNGSLFIALAIFSNNFLGSNTYTKFYGSSFVGGYYIGTHNGKTYYVSTGLPYASTTNGKWINCVFNGGFGYWTGSGTLKRCEFVNGVGVTYVFNPNFSIEDCNFIMTSSSGGMFMLYASSYLNTGRMKGMKWTFDVGGYLFKANTAVNSNSIYNFQNPSPCFPTSNLETNKLIVPSAYLESELWHIREYYTFDLKITDVDGNAIEGAEVTLTNADNDVVLFTTTTASDGTITQQEVLRQDAHYDGGYLFDVTENYKLTISKAGYQTQTHFLVINEQKDLSYSLSSNNLIGDTINAEIINNILQTEISDENIINAEINNIIINTSVEVI